MLGVAIAATPADAVADADIVVICVSDTPDVEAVLFGPDGVVAGARPGTLIIDCSTIAPSGSWDFAARLRERSLAMVDAPVSGGSEGAQKATLTIFVGGDADDVERARPVLAAMGKTITHVGPIGAGQAVKAVNQVILAGAYLGVAEGIVLAIKAGLDVEQVVGALGGGAAQSWVLANRSGRMLDNDYPLGFKVALHRKDLGIALDLAGQLGAVLPLTALAAQLETGLIAGGHADEDMSVIARTIRGLSGLEGVDASVEADQQHRVAELAVVAGAEARRRCTSPGRRPCAARAPDRAGACARTCRPGWRPCGPSRRTRRGPSRRWRRSSRPSSRPSRARPAEVVGQLRGERLDAGPRLELGGQRLADVGLVAMAEHVGVADVRHLRPCQIAPSAVMTKA